MNLSPVSDFLILSTAVPRRLLRGAGIAGLLGLSLTFASRADEADQVWAPADAVVAQRGNLADAWINPPVARHYRLDDSSLRTVLTRAPFEGRGGEPAIFKLPMADGSVARFRIVETSVMDPVLAAKFPEIKTYLGEGVDDPDATARFGWGPAGFYAQVLSPRGAYYVEPKFKSDATLHVAYLKRDYPRAGRNFSCLTPSGAQSRPLAARSLLRAGPTLNVYRLACAATGEYTAFHGGTVVAGQNAIVQAINRINGVYETELAIRLTLVANNNLLVFTNAATDPYNNFDGFSMLFQNQARVDQVIGNANYDVGHVFSTGGGGIAGLGVVCIPGEKAQGVTGSPSPVGDSFWIDYVAHELGHQFGANHTFNSTAGACFGNRNDFTAYEPGSGSTIMAYAGICAADDLQPNSDPFFHSVSFDEIQSYISLFGNCIIPRFTGNAAPTVDAGTNFTIPIGTAFTLTATGNDANARPLTFCWEERDLGPEQPLGAADNGTSPIFRSFPPTTNRFRVFPKLSSIISGTPSLGEQLPTLGRTMNFRVTARDNRTGGGGVNTADTFVVVDATSGPFVVTAPGAITNRPGPLLVTWNVANTTNALVGASNVNIRLSVDGGLTFPVLLAGNTPNDGNQTVNLPPVPTVAGRIRVEAVSNIFFDISDADFTIDTTGNVDLALNGSVPPTALLGSNLTWSLTVTNVGTNLAAGVVLTNLIPTNSIFVSAAASQGTFGFNNGMVTFNAGSLDTNQSATFKVTIIPTSLLPLTNAAVVGSLGKDTNLANNVVVLTSTVIFSEPTLAAGSTSLVGESPLTTDGAIEPGETVTVEFGVVAVGAGITSNLVATLLPLNGVTAPGPSQSYGALSIVSGEISRPFTFTVSPTNTSITAKLSLQDGTNFLGFLDYPFTLGASNSFTNSAAIIINDNTSATPYPSSLSVTGLAGTLGRATVTLSKFTHAFPDDVDVLLVGPAGQKVMLMSDAGGSSAASNLVLTFDDAAGATVLDDGPLFGGMFKPTDYERGETLPAPAPAGAYATNLSALFGTDPNGIWSLYVTDDSPGDAGQITAGWTLNVATATVLNQPGDLALTAQASVVTVAAGHPVTYTFFVTNAGPSHAKGATINHVLPPGAIIVATNLSQGTVGYAGGVLAFNLGTLSNASVATASVTIVPATAGLATNTVSVTASRAELTPANNVVTMVTTVTTPVPTIIPAGVTLTAENFLPRNAGLDPGETVTLRFALRNVGTADTTNLVATLLATGGVLSPSGSQIYGALTEGGLPGDQPFTFTVGSTAGVLTATLQLQDGPVNLGTVSFDLGLGAQRTYTNSAAIVINDFGPATPYPSAINISGVTGLVTKVTVTLSNFSHSFPADVDVLLVTPNGRAALLMSDAGTNSPVSGLTLKFDDSAAFGLPGTGTLTSGSFRPTDFEPGDAFDVPGTVGPYNTNLTSLNGIDPNGTWSLYVRDDTAGDAGQIVNGWRLDLTTANPLIPVADLVISGVSSPNPALAGTNLAYTLTVSNRGPVAASGVQVTNLIPAGAALLFVDSSQGSVTFLGQTIFASLGSLGSGASATLNITVAPSLNGFATNVAGVNSVQTDLVPENNTIAFITTVGTPPPPFLGAAGPSTNGVFQFEISSSGTLNYVIEATTNLVNWFPIATNITVGGKITFIDPAAPFTPVRFYRARQLGN